MQLISHDQTGNGTVRVRKRSGVARPVARTCFEFLIKARPTLSAQLERFVDELVETLAPVQGVSLHFGPIAGASYLWRLDVFVMQGCRAVRTLPEDVLNRLIQQSAIQSLDVRHYPCRDQHSLRIAG